ncbi:MAG: hypothetical protein CMF41_01745 [Legionellales bacterium]|nr:hypothetical protein [Legionellales bacterium]OUX65964.1 MAG: hypothetical protein CBE41_00955 [Gammaproteobacteria bacterium TMED281]
MSHSWLFYDVESSDLNPVFGQIMQYASIRVDDQWCEVDRTMFYVQLTHDRILSPEAMLVHRIPVDYDGSSYNEAKGAEIIHDQVNTPNTYNGGYNTLGYDDEVLRFTFYRNFLDPYSHGFRNGCQRFDLFPMVLLFYFYNSTVIKWPKKSNGAPSFKLEHINEANNLATGQAHDALVDVSVCVELGRKLFSQSETWKEGLSALSQRYFPEKLHVMLDPRFDMQKRFGSVVWKLGDHVVYKNTSFWVRMDLIEFESIDDVKKTMVKKRAGDTRVVIALNESMADNSIVEKNKNWLESNQSSVDAYSRSLTTHMYSMVQNLDVDAGLYAHGPFSPSEQKGIQMFKKEIERWEEIVKDQPPRLQKMMFRYIWRHHADLLGNQHDVSLLEDVLSVRFGVKDFRGRVRPSASQVLGRCEALIAQSSNAEDLALLSSLRRYIQLYCLGVADAVCV